jgi:mRNA-degrading endonuclease HigB of HigAB toxin-antitoxin module
MFVRRHNLHRGIKAARSQYDAWLDIVTRAEWRNPEDVKASYPKASILKAGRVVFNIKGNDYRLIARVQYQAGVRHLMDQHGLTRADMVPILGTPSRVSEVLRGKKGLSMAMVQRLRARFRVPADLLLPPPKKAPARRAPKRAAA